MDAKVYSVESVWTAFTKSNPPGVIIQALGTVTSSGWSNGRLVPRIYITPPSDGVWDFDFIATRPSGISLPALRPIEAQEYFHPLPSWFKGARVHASTNTAETLQESQDLKQQAMNWVPFPWGIADAAPLRLSDEAVDGGIDNWPWSMPHFQPSELLGKGPVLSQPVSSLIGKRVRVYRDGDAITKDHVPDRVNVVLARMDNVIHDIYLG